MGPVIFSTKFFELHTLWIFVAIGLITATIVLIRLSIKTGLKIQFISENSWKLIFWGLVGARLLAILINYNIYFYEISSQTFIKLFNILDKGLEFWGAIIGMAIYFYFLCKKSDQSFWKWLDVLVPSIILGLAIGDIGAFFEGSSYGTPSSLPWAVNFENPGIKYSVAIHPTQIYAFLYSAIIFIGLLLLRQTKKIKNLEPSGLIGLMGIGIFSFFQFLEEFIRGDDTIILMTLPLGNGIDLRIGHLAAFIALVASLVLIYRRYFAKKTTRLISKQI